MEIFLNAKTTRRTEEDLDEIIIHLVSYGLYGFIGYVLWLATKIIVAAMICKHNELSDDKVKYLTHMISKNQH